MTKRKLMALAERSGRAEARVEAERKFYGEVRALYEKAWEETPEAERGAYRDACSKAWGRGFNRVSKIVDL